MSLHQSTRREFNLFYTHAQIHLAYTPKISLKIQSVHLSHLHPPQTIAPPKYINTTTNNAQHKEKYTLHLRFCHHFFLFSVSAPRLNIPPLDCTSFAINSTVVKSSPRLNTLSIGGAKNRDRTVRKFLPTLSYMIDFTSSTFSKASFTSVVVWSEK